MDERLNVHGHETFVHGAAKHNAQERRKLETTREGGTDKSFRLLRGKLRRPGEQRIKSTRYQMEGIHGLLAQIGSYPMRKKLMSLQEEIEKEEILYLIHI